MASWPRPTPCSIKVQGNGGHGAMPHLTVDAMVVGAHIVVALQTVVSRNIDPRQMAVVTVGAFHAGNAPNVIAGNGRAATDGARLRARGAPAAARAHLELVAGAGRGVRRHAPRSTTSARYPALQNDAAMTEFARACVTEWLGEDGLIADLQPLTGSEDFSFMLAGLPGLLPDHRQRRRRAGRLHGAQPGL